jgi:hypothetical protein
MFLDVNVDGIAPPEGRSAHIVDFTSVDEHFFEAAGIPLLAGRTFTSADDSMAAPVAVINQAMARRFWPDESPLGRIIRVEVPGFPPVEVVGVVGTAKIRSLGEAPTPFLYLPYAQQYNAWVSFVAVSRGDPQAASQDLFRMVREGYPEVIVTATMTLDEHIGIVLFFRQLSAALMGVVAVLALGLAVLGLYGVVSYAVARRAREMGIRRSLGAAPSSVVTLQLRQGLRLVVMGGAVGLFAAFLAAQGLSGFFFGISAADPITYGAVVFVLGSTSIVAAYLPARRASRVSPVDVLKRD